MLDTVLRNLASNALKFTPRGGKVNLSARVKPGEPDTSLGSEFIEVTVADTGIGMNQDSLENLFRLDVSQNTPGTEQEEGTGLGLIICKEMIEQNGGQIWIKSEPGKGTTVGFRMPQVALAPPPAAGASTSIP
jgi:signal transduction histidine kinase